MTSILQCWQRVLVHGKLESSRLQLLLLRRLQNRQESCSLALMKLATEANNSVLVVVRAALAFTSSSSTPLPVVEAAARASKYPSRSAADLVGPFACWTWGATWGTCLSTPLTAPNWSWPSTACFLTLSFWLAILYSFSQADQYFLVFGKVLPDFVRSREMLQQERGV